MAKKFRVRDRLLLGLALMGDLVDQFMVTSRRMKRYHVLNFWTPPGCKLQNYRHTVWRMLKADYIEKVSKNGMPYLRISTYGKKIIQRDFPFLAMQKKGWNGKWCIVIFDISEKEKKIRESLREKLKRLGFGQLQRSIYISPYHFEEDMVEFLKAHGLFGNAFVLTCRHRLMGDPKDMANLVWGLDRINEEYENIFYNIKKSKKFREIEQLKEEYLQTLNKDPFLPKELLPNIWYGTKILKLISRL